MATGTASADVGTTKQMSVNLASVTGPSTGVGQGILYGVTADAAQPTDEYLKPLQLNAFRGGGWYAGGWVKDGYTYGAAMKQEIATIIAQGQRLQKIGTQEVPVPGPAQRPLRLDRWPAGEHRMAVHQR